MTDRKITLAAQVNEAKRQLAMMRDIYPQMLKTAAIDEASAKLDLELFAAAVTTLEWLHSNEARVRAAVTKAAPFDLESDAQLSPREAHRFAIDAAAEIAAKMKLPEVAKAILGLREGYGT